MAEEKYVLISLEDKKAGKLAEAINNKTCRKILDLLAEDEASESEIAEKLKLPLNTIDYDVKKLKEAGLIEEKRHLFSVKGKRIPIYRISNKNIVISPRKTKKLTGILPVMIIASIFTGFLLWFNRTKEFVADNAEKVLTTPQISIASEAAEGARNIVSGFHLGTLEIFLIVIWLLIAIFIIITIVRRSK
jgi:DNA-binding transcriptional ArsR family regulator